MSHLSTAEVAAVTRQKGSRTMVEESTSPVAGSDQRPHDIAEWRPVSRIRAYELVLERVEEQILSGALRVGDRLPAERDLAARLEVSRAAVREAIRTLEAQGVVRSSVGAGPDGGTVVAAMPSQALTQLLRLHVALSNFPMGDVVEARVMLERSSARLAAEHATADDLLRMRQHLEGMDDQQIDREAFNELDTAFHVTIAKAARNRLVADMTIAIRDSMRLPILRAFRVVEDWDVLVHRLRADHHGIYDAIASRAGQLAADLVDTHIRSAYASLPAMAATATFGPNDQSDR